MESKNFIEKYFDVHHARKGIIPLVLYDHQIEALKDLTRFDRTIHLSSRQIGMTTLLECYMAWLALSKQDQRIYFLSSSYGNSLRMISNVARNVTKFDMTSEKYKNKISFKNGSTINIVTSASDFCSVSMTHLIIDNAAFVKDLERLVDISFTMNSNIAITSSAHSPGTFFHSLCCGAELRDNTYIIGKYDYSVFPERDNKWLEDNTYSLSDISISREYLCKFA